MTVEKLSSRKSVVVGIRFDPHAREMLAWALLKVADSGDRVVAVHVCRNSDCFLKERALLNGYLEDFQSYCLKKKIALVAEVLIGNSIKRTLVREAKKYDASAVIVGVNWHTADRGSGSTAHYCATRLPQSTQVMVIYCGKLTFYRSCMNHIKGPGHDLKSTSDLSDSHLIPETRPKFGEILLMKNRLSYDERRHDNTSSAVERRPKSSLSSVSLSRDDFAKQSPGWPLLQTVSPLTQPELQARKLSVVKWVMNLPDRSSSEISEENKAREEYESGHHNELWTKDLDLIIAKNSSRCTIFSHEFFKTCTREFSPGNLVGKGGCNSVYKGVVPGGKQIAVKVSKSSTEARKNFIREVDIMTSLKHNNIASLLGICMEDNTSLISVYDLLPKGNLEENLHGCRMKNSVLSWEVRFKIAVGIAQALNYLHNECSRPVIHRDVKSSNILLSDELSPQLCDFGYAIWGPAPGSALTYSDVVGTFGYIAPEYFMYGKVSDKIDVYAFGVVLLELLSGRHPIRSESTKDQESLVMWAKPKLERGDSKSLLDPKLGGNIDDFQVQRMAVAAKSCLHQSARLRPKMNQILKILSGKESAVDSWCDVDSENDDDEVYPDSSAESHLSLAFLDVEDKWESFSSRSSSPKSIQEYVKKRWSRSSTLKQLLLQSPL